MTYIDPEQIDDRLAQLIQRLREHDNLEAAAVLQGVRDGAYATGSEWCGELGRALREVERKYEVESQLQPELAWLIDRIREVWPFI